MTKIGTYSDVKYVDAAGRQVSNELDIVQAADKTILLRLSNVVEANTKLDNIILLMQSDFPSSWKFNKLNENAYDVLDGSGTKWATVNESKVVASARTQIGTPGNPVLNKIPLVKSTVYEVDGFLYQTDDLGRVINTQANLDDVIRVRLGNQQIRAVDLKDGIRGEDQGGHIIASRFFGPGEQINLYPMSAKLNLNEWKAMESNWANAIVDGKDVKISIDAIYTGSSSRPDRFRVIQEIDGEETILNFINN